MMDSDHTVLKTVTLYCKIIDLQNKIMTISDLISRVEFDLNANRFQCYTGVYLDIMETLRGSKSKFMYNSSDSTKECWITLPFVPQIGQTLPIGYIRNQQLLTIVIDFVENNEASIISSNICIDIDNKHPLSKPNKIPPVVNCKQIQFTGSETLNTQNVKLRLNFAGPIESIFMKFFMYDNKTNKVHSINWIGQILDRVTIRRGATEIVKMPGSYFNTIMPQKMSGIENTDNSIFCWTFAYEPNCIDSNRPTGTMDLGASEYLTIQLEINPEFFASIEYPQEFSLTVDMYAHVWNQLKVENGFCGYAHLL